MPIFGHGDIASVLTDKPDITYFASGVSNSLCTDNAEFEREKDLLFTAPVTKRLVYFSSLSIYYKYSAYTMHKRVMENLVKQNFTKYCIVRIGNIDWGKNPNTIINYFKRNPDAEIQEGFRYVVSKEDFLHWVDLIPNFNTEMNITGQKLTIKQIYEKAVHTNK